ncbi:MAG TPA: LysR family transcriptional regulator [Terriglobales bacterium]|nr:LysR family transcriptional regulator [Terriglobales bacterium]
MAQLENFRLKVFRTVADHLNFRKAAEHLFITQPAVTLQIKALEDDLGIRLFDRAAGRISLTPQGTILLSYAKRIANVAAEAEQKLGDNSGGQSGELLLGVSTTIAQYVLPRLLGAFIDEHPRVHFSLSSGNTDEIVQLVLAEKVAVGLIEGPTRDRGVRTEPFMDDELVLIVSKEYGSDRLTVPQLVTNTLLMREQGSGSRRVVEASLKKAGIKLKSFRSIIDLDSTEAIKSAVEAGLGVGFVSRWALSKELELNTLKIVEVPGVRASRQFTLVMRTGPEPKGPAAAFRNFAVSRARLLSTNLDKLKHSARSRR